MPCDARQSAEDRTVGLDELVLLLRMMSIGRYKSEIDRPLVETTPPNTPWLFRQKVGDTVQRIMLKGESSDER